MSPTPKNALKHVSIQVHLNLGTQGSHQQHHIQYQSRCDSVCILRCLSSKIQLNQELKVHRNTIANINSDTAQSVFSGICLLQDTIQTGTQGSHEYHNQYQSIYDSVCILGIIPNLSFKKVIQDASCLLTKKNYSHSVIKAGIIPTECILGSMLQVKLINVITRFT